MDPAGADLQAVLAARDVLRQIEDRDLVQVSAIDHLVIFQDAAQRGRPPNN
jgi:hypothetical protein